MKKYRVTYCYMVDIDEDTLEGAKLYAQQMQEEGQIKSEDLNFKVVEKVEE